MEGTDQLIFSTTPNISGNLSRINFYSDAGVTLLGGGGALLDGNEIVPVPEPATVLAILALFAFMGYHERRRLVALFRRLRA